MDPAPCDPATFDPATCCPAPFAIVPIEQIQPGDLVYAHDGRPHELLRTIKRHYRGAMYGLSHAKSAALLWLTEDHFVLCRKRVSNLGGSTTWEHIPKQHFTFARQLRRDKTYAEATLWSSLRDGRFNVKFRRQHPIGPYIADFYCREKALVVEVDGRSHAGEQAANYDAERVAFLKSLGLRVIRFSDSMVVGDLDNVLRALNGVIEETLPAGQYEELRRADSLQAGDEVCFWRALEPVRLVEVRKEVSEEDVYNLEVQGAHSFVTEVCAVHNCGSGTTAYVAEQWDRRWITCDTRPNGPASTAQPAASSTNPTPASGRTSKCA